MTTIPGQPIILSIDDSSKVGEARRTAVALANGLGFDATRAGKVAIMATEAATNLAKHAERGELILSSLESRGVTGLEILAIDRGPGMHEPGRCLEDGYSTAGSPGNGLGALRRLASNFDFYTIPGQGTALMVRIWASDDLPAFSPPRRLEYGVVSRPALREEVCGDGWSIAEDANVSSVMVVDGLGHGPQAAEASRAATSAFLDHWQRGPLGILQAAHQVMRDTRGAAMAVAQVDQDRGEVRFAGVGNISGVIHSRREGRNQNMISQNGTVGHTVRKFQDYTYSWNDDDVLIMHSDGLGTQWHLERYAGISARHPTLTAAVLYRDFTRGRDDVTVLVARETSASLS